MIVSLNFPFYIQVILIKAN